MIRDLRWSWRQGLQSPRSTFAILSILTLTTAAATALFSAVGPLWLSPLPFPQSDRLVVLWEQLDGQPNLGLSTSIGLHSQMSQELGDLGPLASARPILPVMWLEDRPTSLKGARVTTSFLQILGIHPSIGRDFRPEDERPTHALPILISHRIWRSAFGSEPDLSSVQIFLDFGGDPVPAEVIGVLPQGMPIAHPLAWDPVDILTVLPEVETPDHRHFSTRSYRMIGRLNRTDDLEELRQRGAAVAERAAETHPTMFNGWRFRAQSANELIVSRYRQALRILAALTVLVWLTACVNIAMILAARHGRRAAELNLRAALGAGPWAIPRLLLTEGLLMAAIATIPGLLAAGGLLHLLRRLSEDTRLQELRLQPEAALFAVVLCAGSAVFFSLVPALLARRSALTLDLGARGNTRHDRWQRRLLTLEVAAGLMLLATAVSIGIGFFRLMSIDPGFSTEGILAADLRQSTVRGGSKDPALYEQVVRAVEGLSLVESAGIIRFPPMSGKSITIELRDRDDQPIPTAIDGLGPRTLQTLGIPILEGRLPAESDLSRSPDTDSPEGTSSRVAWISRSLADRLGEDGQVGRSMRLGPVQADFRIAGIVGDIHRISLIDPPQPTVYITYTDFPRLYAHLLIKLKGKGTRGDRLAVEQTLKAIDPRLVVEDVRPLSPSIARTVERERIMTFVCAALTLLGLALVTSGVWAVVIHRVQRRRREMGIRLALGAPPESLRNNILKLTIIDVAQGLGLGLVAGLLTAEAMAAILLLEGEHNRLAAFLVASLWLLLLALSTAYVAARRLRRLDPAVILREE